MKTHFSLSDSEFLRHFHTGILEPSLFTHEAHLRLTWLYIKNFEIDVATNHLQTDLKKYVHHIGAGEKYNETLSVAAVKAVYHFFLKSEAKTFPDFIEEFPRLKNNFKGPLLQHYSIELMTSSRAKSQYLEPNLLPFI